MPRADSNGIEIEYDTFGSEQDPALLLVMGLGAQMTAWDDEFCARLAGRGFFVVRFDNRDVGLSTKLESARVDVAGAMLARLSGQSVADAPYTLADMADDAFGLLDALGIDRAHVVGASMGGMIAQTMVIARPERVLSLTSIMSTTGQADVGEATPEAIALLMTPPPTDKEGFVASAVQADRLLGGAVLPFDEERSRRKAAERYDRSFYPIGVGRQLVAIVASGDRTEALAKVEVPTLVVHGDADPLVGHSGGVATAKAVPGAELRTIEGMGHSLPPAVWDDVVDAIATHAERSAA